MDKQFEVNKYKKTQRHFSKLMLSCAIGGGIGHLTLLLILSFKPQLLTEYIRWINIDSEILRWSALLYVLMLLGFKFLADCLHVITQPIDAPGIPNKCNKQTSAKKSKLDESLRRVELKDIDQLWKGFRSFTVDHKEFETPDKSVCSFYLRPYDRQWLPPFSPGQYLTFRLDHIETLSQPLIRCYSLSDEVNKDYYRVSIKRLPAPGNRLELSPGLSSNYFHDYIKVGDVLDVKAPSGHFYLNHKSKSGVVLIAGGVGFTPMISILNALLSEPSQRGIWFFYGVINSDQHAMKEYLEDIAQNHSHVHLVVCYSKPMEIDEEGVDYQFRGRVSVDLMKQHLPANNFEYYICGPDALIFDVTKGLKAWGVPDNDVYYEAFGPATDNEYRIKCIGQTIG